MKSLRLFILLFTITTLFACSGEQVVHTPGYPMFWTWLNYRPGMNFDSVCVVMKETGIDGVMLNAPTPDDYRQAIPIAHKHGIEVYAWLWTMNLEHDRDKIIKEHPEWFSVNRKGESLADSKAYVDYYKFMCPALPEVREYIKNKIKAYCEVEGLNGIAIDYHRFVDVILPTTLWPRYGIVQDREYPEWDFGYHPAMIELFEAKYGYDPREQDDPSIDELWLQFRCDQITEVTNEIADVVHSYGKTMAASPFPTPSMSRQMVRQDWGNWNLDIVFPMVYHSFYTGDVSFISDCTIDNAKDKNPNTTLYCGMMISADNEEVFECMDAALNNGAEGVAIFTIGSLRSPEIRSKFKAYTDSVKDLRAKNMYPARASRSVNTNPFENSGITSAIHMRMQAYISMANATRLSELKNTKWEIIDQVTQSPLQANTHEDYLKRLTNAPRRDKDLQPVAEAVARQFRQDGGTLMINPGTYKLTDQYGVTKCYQVTEQNSRITFHVTFYFYGGVLSGWSIQPEENSYEAYRKKI